MAIDPRGMGGCGRHPEHLDPPGLRGHGLGLLDPLGLRKTIGKPSENHRKTIGSQHFQWENHRKTLGKW